MEFIPLVTKIQAIEAELRSSRRGAQDVIATISIAINGEERQKVFFVWRPRSLRQASLQAALLPYSTAPASSTRASSPSSLPYVIHEGSPAAGNFPCCFPWIFLLRLSKLELGVRGRHLLSIEWSLERRAGDCRLEKVGANNTVESQLGKYSAVETNMVENSKFAE
ncbi:hypothetical protein DL95DRAFT_410519 [Leptodontidium sp. 2 PMI_412]|nr:hypothetical protein DL95DRAFT_410519 [Leptodontidium sp. 2 PMI_412]